MDTIPQDLRCAPRTPLGTPKKRGAAGGLRAFCSDFPLLPIYRSPMKLIRISVSASTGAPFSNVGL